VDSDGDDSFCAVLLSSGGVDCWGSDTSGELGDGGITLYVATPGGVTGISNAVSVTGNGSCPGYCALLSTGSMGCWGDNTYGELGNGRTGGPNVSESMSGYNTPQPVTSITNGVSVTDDYEGYCAVLSTGSVECWGVNYDGQLGNGAIGGADEENGYDTPRAVSSQ
jgi:alpha-tubulin suppressor-like RCC1 family protein